MKSTLSIAMLFGTVIVHAQVALTVGAGDNIFGAGFTSAPAPSGGSGGSLPPGFAFTPEAGLILTLQSTSGAITLTGGIGPYDADGTTSFGATNVSAYNSLSGIQSNASGFLVGVFLGADTPSGAAPPSLNFGPSGLGSDFLTLAPQLQQTFLVGDGRTISGSLQQFLVPAGASRLYFGFADAYGYNGPPGQYQDNSGSLLISFQIIPEPATIMLLGLGLAVISAWRPDRITIGPTARRKRRASQSNVFGAPR